MSNHSYLSISEFAKITCISRVNLIFYDKIDLLKPDHRKENGYRYYSSDQLSNAFLIVSLREIGISIDEIKAYATTRSPERMLALFKLQEKRIQKEIQKLVHINDMMNLYSDMTIAALKTNIEDIQVLECDAEHIFMGPYIQYSQSMDDAWSEFYDYATVHEVELSYPVGLVFAKEQLLTGTVDRPQNIYFKTLSPSTMLKPAGRYVVGYMHGGYDHSDMLYIRLLNHIKEHHLTICGNAYEEYPLSEVSTQNQNEYLIKLQIMVV